MQTCLKVYLVHLVIFILLQFCVQSLLRVHFNYLAYKPWGIELYICDMSVVGKLATCILNNAYVCLVNKLFKDDFVLNILRKNISKIESRYKLASFHLHAGKKVRKMYGSFAWEDQPLNCNGSRFCLWLPIFLQWKCSKICDCSLEIHF